MFLSQVQSGGSFDVDYSVIGPGDKQILQGEKERQGDYVFTAQSTGSYSFCFSNTMSTFADKYVDFEITSEANPGSSSSLLPQKSGAPAEQHDQLEDLVFKVSGQLSTVNRMQKYFRTRENRNFSTVRSTEKRIFQFSLIEVMMMVGMAVLQVLVVRFFFQGARKGECSLPNCEKQTSLSTLQVLTLLDRLCLISKRSLGSHVCAAVFVTREIDACRHDTMTTIRSKLGLTSLLLDAEQASGAYISSSLTETALLAGRCDFYLQLQSHCIQ